MTSPRTLLAPVLLAAALAAPPADAGETSAPKLHFDPFEKPAVLTAPPPPAATAVAEPPPWAPVLRAVMVAGAASMANVDGHLLRMGEEVDGYRLVEVTDRRAVFERDGVLRELVIE